MAKKRKIMAGVLALCLIAPNAYAAQSIDKAGNGAGHGAGKSGSKVETKHEDSVTDSVYGGNGGKGSGGLTNAYEHVKHTPAGPRIAELLKVKYGIEVQADADMSEIVDGLESDGQLEAAVDAQTELLTEDLADLEGYKKLGRLKIKLGDKGVKTYVNGKTPKFDVPPVIIDGRALVPFRAIAESLNAEVGWDPETRTVTVVRGDITVQLVLESKTALVNGKEVELDVASLVKNDRVLIPLRFLGEALDAEVLWEAETSSAVMIDPSAASPGNAEDSAQE